MTLREFYLSFRAWLRRNQLEYNQSIATAWHTAAFERQKRLKALDHYLLKPKRGAKKLSKREVEKELAEFDEAVARLAPDARKA